MKEAAVNSPGDKNYTTTLTVYQSPEEVFAAINNVRGWWAKSIEGVTDQLNAEFLQYFRDIHIAKMKIVELIPGKRIKWQVLDSHLNFVTDKTEWKDTEICFEISREGNKTKVLFTHLGLVPEYECYDVCRDAWSDLLHKSLHKLITTGNGQPNPREKNLFNNRQANRWQLMNV